MVPRDEDLSFKYLVLLVACSKKRDLYRPSDGRTRGTTVGEGPAPRRQRDRSRWGDGEGATPPKQAWVEYRYPYRKTVSPTCRNATKSVAGLVRILSSDAHHERTSLARSTPSGIWFGVHCQRDTLAVSFVTWTVVGPGVDHFGPPGSLVSAPEFCPTLLKVLI